MKQMHHATTARPWQEFVLLMDDAGYMMEVSTPDFMPTR